MNLLKNSKTLENKKKPQKKSEVFFYLSTISC
jgi:hypothetical protein